MGVDNKAVRIIRDSFLKMTHGHLQYVIGWRMNRGYCLLFGLVGEGGREELVRQPREK